MKHALPSTPSGFTLIEMVLVIALVAIMLVLMIPVSRQFQVSALLTSETAALVADLRRSQAAAVAGANDSAHGVHFDPTPTDRWVLFRGNTYVQGAPENEVHALPSVLDITTVTLTGGGQDILFTERRGMTGNSGLISLRAPNGETRTVSVNGRGVVEVQ